MNQTLNGKTALVTGGGRGIGAAIALKLAQLGTITIVCGRTLARLQHTAGQIRSAGGQGEAMACDVADWNSVAALADRVQKTFGRLDVLVNNAGIGTFGGPLHTMPIEKWDAMFNTNLRGVFYMIRAFCADDDLRRRWRHCEYFVDCRQERRAQQRSVLSFQWGLNGLTYSVAEEAARATTSASPSCVPARPTRNSARTKARIRTKCCCRKMWPTLWEMLVTQRPQAFVAK